MQDALSGIESRLAAIEKKLNSTQTSESEYLDIKGLSKYIHQSLPTIYAKTAARQIPYLKQGKLLLFQKKAIDKWLQEGNVPTIQEMVDKSVA